MRYSPMRYSVIVGAALVAACGRASSDPAATEPLTIVREHEPASHVTVQLTPQALRELAELRAATKRYRRHEVALAAGYKDSLTECMTDPVAGGMGLHYGWLSRFDGTVQHDVPEILVYEPQKDGSLRFVAVEFAIPFGAWTGDTAPSLFGQPFHKNFRFGLWVLHVWIGRENPNGLFMDYNPKVSCPRK